MHRASCQASDKGERVGPHLRNPFFTRAAIAGEIKRQVWDFKPHVPLVIALRYAFDTASSDYAYTLTPLACL